MKTKMKTDMTQLERALNIQLKLASRIPGGSAKYADLIVEGGELSRPFILHPYHGIAMEGAGRRFRPEIVPAEDFIEAPPAEGANYLIWCEYKKNNKANGNFASNIALNLDCRNRVNGIAWAAANNSKLEGMIDDPIQYGVVIRNGSSRATLGNLEIHGAADGAPRNVTAICAINHHGIVGNEFLNAPNCKVVIDLSGGSHFRHHAIMAEGSETLLVARRTCGVSISATMNGNSEEIDAPLIDLTGHYGGIEVEVFLSRRKGAIFILGEAGERILVRGDFSGSNARRIGIRAIGRGATPTID